MLKDGSLWTLMPNDPPLGRDFEAVALSFGVFCARRTSGAVSCFAPPFAGESLSGRSCADSRACPVFPAGRYRSITATGTVACAIDETGALICKRHDGADMPISPGPYTLARGGLDTLCAIRIDGSVACFRHGGGGFVTDDIGSLPRRARGRPACERSARRVVSAHGTDVFIRARIANRIRASFGPLASFQQGHAHADVLDFWIFRIRSRRARCDR